MKVKELLTDLILDELANADEDTLERVYRDLRNLRPVRRSDRPTLPAEPTRDVVIRALARAGRPVKLRAVERLVKSEHPEIGKSSISGTLSKLVGSGKVRAHGQVRLREYELV